jgi:hypothetical protein
MYARSKTPIFNKPHPKHVHKNVSFLPPILLLSLQPYPPPRHLWQRQQRKRPPHDRAIRKRDPRIIATRGIVQVRQRPIRRGVVNPGREVFDKHIAGARARDRSYEQFPVALRVPVPCVERHAVGLGYRWVEGGLHVVDGLRDEVEFELGV